MSHGVSTYWQKQGQIQIFSLVEHYYQLVTRCIAPPYANHIRYFCSFGVFGTLDFLAGLVWGAHVPCVPPPPLDPPFGRGSCSVHAAIISELLHGDSWRERNTNTGGGGGEGVDVTMSQ